MRNAITVTVLAASLLGCAAIQPRNVTLASQFEPAEVAWASKAGTGTVTGQAFFQTRGGEPRTCAGTSVDLVPDSDYLRERLLALYGNTTNGYRSAVMQPVKFSSNSTEYRQAARRSVCDAQGNFEFTALPAGKYYVLSQIQWVLPGHYLVSEGGWLMQAVELAEGESKRVILTR